MAKTSRLTQIYQAERKRGGGLASTIGKATLEKIDPRQFFNQQGLLAAVLPSLFKAYKAPGQSGSTTPTALKFSTSSLENKIDNLAIHTKISAKNSLVLPSMARDMNLMRQNIAKMLKLQGGKPSYKSDMFFMRAGEREAAYESQFKKSGGTETSTKPTAAGGEEGGGFLGSLLGFFKSSKFFLMIGALIGAAIVGLAVFFKDEIENIRKKIKEVFDSITFENIISSIQSFVDRLRNAIKNLPSGFNQPPGSITSGGESPENPDIVPNTSSPGLGAVKDEAEKARKIGPKGQKVEVKDGVVGYYRNVGRQGRGNQGQRKFTPLEGEELIKYYESEIKRVEELAGGDTLTAVQLSAQSFASTEAGKIAIERYLKEKGMPTPTNTTPQKVEAPTKTQLTWANLTEQQKDAVVRAQAEHEHGRGKPIANNNPGNIMYGEFAKKFGAKPSSLTTSHGTVAQFPTMEDGFKAQKALWEGSTYKNLPLDEAIGKWAGEKDAYKTKNPELYLKGVENYKKSVIAAAGGTYTPSPVTMASSSIPNNVSQPIKSEGTKIASSTMDVAQAKIETSSTPVVVSPPVVNVQAPQSAMSGLSSSSNVIDTEFMKLLVGRTVTL